MRRTALATAALAMLIGVPMGTLWADDDKEAGAKDQAPRKAQKIERKVEVRVEGAGTDTGKITEKHSYLGVALEPVPDALAAHLPDVLPKGQGLLVTQVMTESPAAKAGLKTHDVLVSYDDQKLLSVEQLVQLVRGDKPGHEVVLSVVRAGKLEKFKVSVGERQVEASDSDQPHRGRMHRQLGPLVLRLHDRDDDKDTPGAKAAKPGTHSRFLSMTLRSTEGDRFKAEVEYKDDKGETRRWSFEGTRDEIRKQLESDKEIPDNIRQQLQRSLNLPGASGGRPGGFGFMMPRGGGMFFGDFDEDGSPDLFLPGGMSIEKWLDQLSKDLDPQVREQLKGSLKNIEPLRKRPVERDRAF